MGNSIEELEREVEAARKDYVGILDSLSQAIGTTGMVNPMAENPVSSLVNIENNRISVERPKLSYEEALGGRERWRVRSRTTRSSKICSRSKGA